MLNQPAQFGKSEKCDNSQVEQQLLYLSESIQVLDGLLDQLAQKIQPVLSAELKAVSEGKPQGSSPLVPLSLKINHNTAIVNDLKDKLQSIIERIQL